MRTLPLLTVLLTASLPGAARAQDAHDRVSFGDDVVVGPGERVHDVVTMGGDATIDGEVTGDVVAMGGDVLVRGSVAGDVVTMGGDLELGDGSVVLGAVSTSGGDMTVASGARATGPRTQSGPTLRVRAPSMESAPILVLLAAAGDATSSLLRHALLFLFALLLLGLAPERFGAVQAVIAREPARVGMLGLGGAIGASLLVALLAVSVVGLPAAIALAVLLALAVYVGLAAVAGVVGAALPVARIHGHPVRELAAGVAILWVASLVPVAGTLALVVVGLVGLGAVLHTRWGQLAPPPGAPLGAGPFRTAATV